MNYSLFSNTLLQSLMYLHSKKLSCEGIEVEVEGRSSFDSMVSSNFRETNSQEDGLELDILAVKISWKGNVSVYVVSV